MIINQVSRREKNTQAASTKQLKSIKMISSNPNSLIALNCIIFIVTFTLGSQIQLASSLPELADATLSLASGPDGTLVYTLADQPESQVQVASQHQQQQTLGHYEFEVAPNLEPPSVRKPPYKHSNQECPGSDPFAGFLPKDTLCGDLNQGRVPLNPLGQNFADQPYPFELIKNKTLQFLARALPILKEEYETIPKVARYVTSNNQIQNQMMQHQHHLLNPTHSSLAPSDEQMDQINRLFMDPSGLTYLEGANSLISPGSPSDAYLPTPPFKRRRRRRKRQADEQHEQTHAKLIVSGSGRAEVLQVPFEASQALLSANAAPKQHQAQQQQMSSAGITIGELGSNASLVVSSAHSAPARSLGMLRLTSGDDGPADHISPKASIGLMTRDGFKQSSAILHQRVSQAINKRSNLTSSSVSVPLNANSKIANPNQSQSDKSTRLEQTIYTSNIQMAGQSRHRHQQQVTSISNNNNQEPSPQVLSKRHSDFELDEHSKYSDHASATKPTKQQQEQAQIQARVQQTHVASQQHEKQPTKGEQAKPTTLDAHQETNSSKAPVSTRQSAAPTQSVSPERQRKTAASQASQSAPCSDQNGFTAAICQVANAVVDGGSAQAKKQPGWLQLVGQLASIYAAPSENSLFSSLSGLFGGAGGGSSNQFEAKSSNSDQSKQQQGSASSQIINLFSSLFRSQAASNSPGYIIHGNSNEQRAAGATATAATAAATSASKQPTESQQLFSQIGNKMLQLALASWATGRLMSMSDNFLPNLMSSFMGSSGFARRKKNSDSREKFVDTPASLAAISSQSPINKRQATPSLAKQPPTPCQSVEEYISPTFARNYQGAWKYVVQIPAEGYFTQTIQRTSCVRQKCEFTEGVCHESPRWVSLLVAEIYYPNAVFGQAPNQAPGVTTNSINLPTELHNRAKHHLLQQQQQQQQLQSLGTSPQGSTATTTPSLHHIQQRHLNQNQNNNDNFNRLMGKSGPSQDPLQMIDSLNTYNHNNLNAATLYANAANEMNGVSPSASNSWPLATEPLTTSQLMSGVYPTLQQRSGLSSGNQQQQSITNNKLNNNNNIAIPPGNQMYNVYTRSNQQQQQTPNPNVLSQQQNQEYLMALAYATLQQNPNLSVEQLLQTLQLPMYQQKRRRRRDINNNVEKQARAQQMTAQGYQGNHVQYTPTNQYTMQQQQHFHNQLLQRNGQLENNGISINDINANPQIMPTNQQQQQQSQQQQQTAIGNPANPNAAQSELDSQLAQQNPSATNNLNNMQSISNQIELAGPVNQPQQMTSSATTPGVATTATSASINNDKMTNVASNQASQTNGVQVDCDGVDKIGCYVVRVYYDWFLVNGSCKCWKTSSSGGSTNGLQSGPTTSSTTTNSFLRRIFTG